MSKLQPLDDLEMHELLRLLGLVARSHNVTTTPSWAARPSV